MCRSRNKCGVRRLQNFCDFVIFVDSLIHSFHNYYHYIIDLMGKNMTIKLTLKMRKPFQSIAHFSIFVVLYLLTVHWRTHCTSFSRHTTTIKINIMNEKWYIFLWTVIFRFIFLIFIFLETFQTHHTKR